MEIKFCSSHETGRHSSLAHSQRKIKQSRPLPIARLTALSSRLSLLKDADLRLSKSSSIRSPMAVIEAVAA
jgi:hypothetical protein